jgi:hypothetical protein
LLCAILGAHLLLFSLLCVKDNPPDVPRSEEAPGMLFFVDVPEPSDGQPSTLSYDPRLERRAARDNAITLPAEIEGTESFIDWSAEASRVAGDAARRIGEEKQFRSLDRHPAGMGPLPPKSSRHESGDSQHFEGGEIVTWIGPGCYYSNQNMPIPAFGQALRLQTPVCTGAGGGGRGKPPPTLEEWKKERDSR